MPRLDQRLGVARALSASGRAQFVAQARDVDGLTLEVPEVVAVGQDFGGNSLDTVTGHLASHVLLIAQAWQRAAAASRARMA